jgi:hypothetical protein
MYGNVRMKWGAGVTLAMRLGTMAYRSFTDRVITR